MQQDRSTPPRINTEKRALGWSPLHPTDDRGQYVSTKVGRNDPCPCGTGRKHKKCCGDNAAKAKADEEHRERLELASLLAKARVESGKETEGEEE